MIPTSLIPIAVIVIVRIIQASTKRGQATRAVPGRAFGLGQPITFFGVVWFLPTVGVLLYTFATYGGFEVDPWTPLLWTALSAAMVFPWTWARHLVIPLGAPRLAYYLAAPPDLRFIRDGSGRRLLAGAWALLYARQPPTPQQLEWFERRLLRIDELRPTLLVVRGFVAAARGAPAATALLEGVEAFDPRTLPPLVRRAAATWLAAEAAERGDWARVLRVVQGGPRLGPSLGLLGAVARRLTAAPSSPSTLGLWLRWAMAPGPWRTFRFVRELAQRPERRPAEPRLPAEPAAAALAAHVALQQAILPRDVVARMSAAAGRWDAALDDPAERQALQLRAAALGSPSPDDVIARLRAAAGGDLARCAERAGVGLERFDAPEGGLLETAAWEQRNQLFEELRLGLDALTRRSEGPLLDPHEEWIEWLRVRALYRALAGQGAGTRRTAFAQAHDPLCNYAVRLFNDEGQRPFGNAIFRFLLHEARLNLHAPAVSLQERNVKAGY